MKKSVMTYALVLLVCLWLTSAARATIVDANESWTMKLQPGETFTAIAHFIPDVPGVPDSLIFPDTSDWIELFDPGALTWDVGLADEGKTAYLYGPAITNDTDSDLPIFSYKLYYQWDDEDVVDYPVYLDVVVFNDLEIVRDFALRGLPHGPWDEPNEDTWKEQHDPESDPYINPIPEPMTICLLGLGTALLIKKRRRKTLSLYKLQ